MNRKYWLIQLFNRMKKYEIFFKEHQSKIISLLQYMNKIIDNSDVGIAKGKNYQKGNHDI